MAGRLSQRVEQFARRTATAVRLEELYRLGLGKQSTRIACAKFMHQEIAIRNAQLCKELRLLPFGLAEAKGTSDVVSWYSSYVDWLAESPVPQTARQEEEFTALLQRILEDNSEVVRTLGSAVQEVRSAMGEERYDEVRSEVDLILDRFFIKRIGLRFLIMHHIESAQARPGVSGIIHSDVAVDQILREVAQEAQDACRAACGKAPEVLVSGHHEPGSSGDRSMQLSSWGLPQQRQFTYVPVHLRFMCLELLKNACTAVARHAGSHASKLQPIHAIFAYGEEEVTIKISDEGGGIPRSETQLAWSYFEGPGTPFAKNYGEAGTSLGVGLPLARLHSRYYGGDLVLKSLEGFGTDAYLFLNRLGQNCENLPHGVRISPAQRDSSVGDVASIRLEALGPLREPEVGFLRQRLIDHRAEHHAPTSDHAIEAG